MTTQIRQPYASPPPSLLKLARVEFKSGERSAAEFSERHGVKRTTAQGWKTKVERKKQLLCKGAQPKLGRYQETVSLKAWLGTATFQSLDTIRDYLKEDHAIAISLRTAQRLLRRWGIAVDIRRHLDQIVDARPLLLWREKWVQPEDTVYESKEPLSGILWLLSTRKGMKGFMLTEDTDEALSLVVSALEATMTPRHRLFTNCLNLVRATAVKFPRWKVTVTDG